MAGYDAGALVLDIGQHLPAGVGGHRPVEIEMAVPFLLGDLRGMHQHVALYQRRIAL